MHTPSVESTLRVQRLKLWRKIIVGGQATAGIRAVAFGVLNFAPSPLVHFHCQPQMLRILKADLSILASKGVRIRLAPGAFLRKACSSLTDKEISRALDHFAPSETHAEVRERRRTVRANLPPEELAVCSASHRQSTLPWVSRPTADACQPRIRASTQQRDRATP